MIFVCAIRETMTEVVMLEAEVERLKPFETRVSCLES